MLSEKAAIITTQCGKHLRRALAVSNISDFLSTRLLKDIFPQRGLIVIRHLLKAEVEELILTLVTDVVQIKSHVVTRVGIAARIVHPQIEACINQQNS